MDTGVPGRCQANFSPATVIGGVGEQIPAPVLKRALNRQARTNVVRYVNDLGTGLRGNGNDAVQLHPSNQNRLETNMIHLKIQKKE